jgi:biotin transport system substrate-specific component
MIILPVSKNPYRKNLKTERRLEMTRQNSLSNTRNLVLCAICAAITCILAPLSIPLAGGVPVSLATFAVMLAGVLLGGSLGAISQLIYVLLGAVGLPVFAGWTGGIGIALGMTGGFIIGYIPCAWLTGLIYHKFSSNAKKSAKVFWMVIGMIAGTIALYALGTVWFVAITGMDIGAALAACVIPFIPGDLIKMAAVVLIGLPVETAIRRTMYAGEPAV